MKGEGTGWCKKWGWQHGDGSGNRGRERLPASSKARSWPVGPFSRLREDHVDWRWGKRGKVGGRGRGDTSSMLLETCSLRAKGEEIIANRSRANGRRAHPMSISLPDKAPRRPCRGRKKNSQEDLDVQVLILCVILIAWVQRSKRH